VSCELRASDEEYGISDPDIGLDIPYLFIDRILSLKEIFAQLVARSA